MRQWPRSGGGSRGESAGSAALSAGSPRPIGPFPARARGLGRESLRGRGPGPWCPARPGLSSLRAAGTPRFGLRARERARVSARRPLRAAGGGFCPARSAGARGAHGRRPAGNATREGPRCWACARCGRAAAAGPGPSRGPGSARPTNFTSPALGKWGRGG